MLFLKFICDVGGNKHGGVERAQRREVVVGAALDLFNAGTRVEQVEEQAEGVDLEEKR